MPSVKYVWHTGEHVYAYVRTLGDVRIIYGVYVPGFVVVDIVVFFTSLRTW